MKCMKCNKQFTPATKQKIYCHECSKYLWCYLCQYRIEDGEYEEYTTCYAKSCQDCYHITHCDHYRELKCNDCMKKNQVLVVLDVFLMIAVVILIAMIVIMMNKIILY